MRTVLSRMVRTTWVALNSRDIQINLVVWWFLSIRWRSVLWAA